MPVNPPVIAPQQNAPQEPLKQASEPSPAAVLEDKSLVKQEEHTEYRDQFGNLLNESQVAELLGKVSFSTHYETRTRVVDADGNVLADDVKSFSGVAPPHPDVEGGNPETPASASGAANSNAAVDDQPASADAKADLVKEQNIEAEKSRGGQAKPGSENQKATKDTA